MSPEPNFFYVNRKLLHSGRWLSEPFTRGQAWVDLFGLAQHTDSFIRIRGVRVDLLRGQLGYSHITLAERWKWSRGKVRRYLSELEKAGDIVQQNGTVTSIITICKYETWQSNGTADGTTDDTADGTADGQQTDSRRYTYNNDNKGKNDKNEKKSARAPQKQKFLEFVFLTEEEHQKLIECLGDNDTRAYIERLNNYIGSKGKKYKSHYHTILNWSQKDHDGERISGTQRTDTSPAGQSHPRINDQDWGELTDPAA